MVTAKRSISDFEQLRQFFDRLAANKSQTSLATRNSGDEETDAQDIASVLKGIIPPSRFPRFGRGSLRFNNKNTSELLNADDASEVASIISTGKFPSEGKRYPFTFKLMIHKLYALEEWAKKVKDVLDISQKQFRPLAEVEERGETEGHSDPNKGYGRARAMSSAGRRPLTVRTRTHSTAGHLGRRHSPSPMSPSRVEPPSPTKLSSSPTKEQFPQDEHVRAIKKRCVGRRKSSSAIGDVASSHTGAWVYDAAASSLATSDSISRRRALAGDSGKESIKKGKYGELENGKKVAGHKRRVSSAAGEWKSCRPLDDTTKPREEEI
ncbi:hypothetical protein EYR38_008848 [Pleurotus pulmonarius]|nr:hypothetical protein EYR38_008848 [Pleurotus pulmonarius]